MARKIATEVADGLKEAVAPFLKAQAGFMQMMAKETSLPRQRLSFGSPGVAVELDDSPKAAEEAGFEEAEEEAPATPARIHRKRRAPGAVHQDEAAAAAAAKAMAKAVGGSYKVPRGPPPPDATA